MITGRLEATPLCLATARSRFPGIALSLAGCTALLIMVWASIQSVRTDPAGWRPMLQAASLAGATLVSEDIAAITAGQLLGQQAITTTIAVGGCVAGIYLGDLGLWLLGRMIGRGVRRHRWVTRWVGEKRLEDFAHWFNRRAGGAILAARFLPGARVPLYIAAGTVDGSGPRFAIWSLFAVLLWTPAIVLLSARFGHHFVNPLSRWLGSGTAIVLGAAGCYAVYRIAVRWIASNRREPILLTISRIWKWEFWPAWVFYTPVACWIAIESIRRGGLRGFSSVTAANPSIPHGGFVGESKSQILAQLDPARVLAFELIEPGSLETRVERFERVFVDRGWTYPIILKPDVGQKGDAIRLARSVDDARRIFAAYPGPLLAQVYHPGPFEAGVFYYRFPDEEHGRIYTITDKCFPQITGDGTHTLEELIRTHSRFRYQADTFCRRHEARLQEILPQGEPFRLAVAGNHCQGTLFRDGAHLITPELERAIDAVVRHAPGIYYGRFDLRYSDLEAFKAGTDFAIIELNGVTAESTNLYDPSFSLFRAYRTVCRQWSILFRVADQNRRRGVRPTPTLQLMELVWNYYRRRPKPAVSD